MYTSCSKSINQRGSMRDSWLEGNTLLYITFKPNQIPSAWLVLGHLKRSAMQHPLVIVALFEKQSFPLFSQGKACLYFFLIFKHFPTLDEIAQLESPHIYTIIITHSSHTLFKSWWHYRKGVPSLISVLKLNIQTFS